MRVLHAQARSKPHKGNLTAEGLRKLYKFQVGNGAKTLSLYKNLVIPIRYEAAHYFSPSKSPQSIGEAPQAMGFNLWIFI